MRNGFETLTAPVRDVLTRALLLGHMNVFRNRPGDRVTLLHKGLRWTCPLVQAPGTTDISWSSVAETTGWGTKSAYRPQEDACRGVGL